MRCIDFGWEIGDLNLVTLWVRLWDLFKFWYQTHAMAIHSSAGMMDI